MFHSFIYGLGLFLFLLILFLFFLIVFFIFEERREKYLKYSCIDLTLFNKGLVVFNKNKMKEIYLSRIKRVYHSNINKETDNYIFIINIFKFKR